MPLRKIPVANAREIAPGLWAAGQPTAEQFAEMAAAGLRTVINLRPEREIPWDERGTAIQLGLDYLNVPLAGAGDLTPAAASQLHAALSAHGKPVLVHCGSSNRVGALFALKSRFIDGRDADAALAEGRAAGLKDLEARVRELLSS